MQDARGTVGITTVRDQIRVHPKAPVTDAAIARHVKAAFNADPLDNLGALAVSVQGGEARLTGKVESALAHERALEVASSVSGVRALWDELIVPAGRQARRSPTDSFRGPRVR